MSHEIRTPLNAVIGLSELTLGEGDLREETKANLEKIIGAGSTILSIVNDILDISKIEAGKLELYPTQYEIPSFVNDVATLNMVRIGEKPIVFRLFVDERLPALLYGDDLRVKQIFNNMLSNAFKYTNAGSVEWRISFERDGDDIWLLSTVKDTGRGMKPEDVRKLFSDYNQVDVQANREIEGTGLGLAITRRLLALMDGTVTVESEYGKGSAFHVRLRQTLVSDAPIGLETAQNLMSHRYAFAKRGARTELTRVNLSYAHVLVVDDIATNLDVAKGMLQRYGLNVDCAESGPKAIEMIKAETPRYAAVFMDHMMPGMDGIEATRVIRKEIGTEYAKNIPIIALTANAIVGNEAMFLSKGFQDFISKPIDMARLDAALRDWVRDKSREEELLSDMEEETGASPLLGVTIEGIDTQRALERFGSGGTALTDIWRSYSVNTRPLLARLREYLEAGDLADYAIVVHGIKGSSYGVFAQEAGASAEKLELAAKAGDREAVAAGHPAFEARIEALLANIDRALEEISAASMAVAAEPDPAILLELREACGAYDIDAVDALMERLEAFRYGRGGSLVAWLRDKVDNTAFEEVSGGAWPEITEG
jgi:CheY-like chemotaxis protein/anti-sigma regulatory factor (Ser/Thr protein kinase)